MDLSDLNPINAISKAVFGDKGIASGVTDILTKAGVLKDTEAIAKTEQALRDYDIALKEKGNEVLKMHLEDIGKARDMQIEALKQGDTFSKRFVYYLALLVMVMVFGFDTLMFFIQYPPENRDMINQVSGILNATALVMVLSFFFGSSKGSNDKQDKMHELTRDILKGNK